MSGTLQIFAADVERFAVLSGDHSPLHVDARYARSTPFGRTVVHGALTVLHALARLDPRPRQRLTALSARFDRPVLPGETYTWESTSDGVRLLAGRRVVLDVRATFGPGSPPPAPRTGTPPSHEAAVLTLDDLVSADPVETVRYQPDWAALTELVEELGLPARGVGAGEAALLAWSSYTAGMCRPGRAATLSRLRLEFGGQVPDFLHGDLRLNVDRELRTVRLLGSLNAGAADLRAAVREEVRRPDRPAVTSTELDGKVALVVGASRGLGAALVQSLAARGCTVYANFQHSRHLAEQLTGSGRTHLLQGDAADTAWWLRVREEIEAPDFLVLNASPPLTDLDLHGDTSAAALAHVQRGIALAQAPLSVFAAQVDDAGGTVVVVSSAVVEQPLPGWSHYVSAKFAVEGLARAAAVEYPRTRFQIIRPPRLRTTFTSAAAADALPPENVAELIVNRLTANAPGTAHVLDPATITAEATPAHGQIAIAATFTAEPVEPVLRQWMNHLRLGLGVVFAPYGQVFQTLIDPAGVFGTNESGVNVVLLRPGDWSGDHLDDFTRSVRQYGGAAPLLVAVPAEFEGELRARLADVRRVHVIGVELERHHDAARERHAHIPYTRAGFAELGTAIARAVHALTRQPYKAVVLDCDNTLWRGVVGEDGVAGIEPDEELQRQVLSWHERGVLVCLCSKNDEADVLRAFTERTDMPLRMDHIASMRIGWQAKSESLREIADELGIGLDAVVFLDDNPLEIAEVSAALPEVLALTPDLVPDLWAFDQLAVTTEDLRRNAAYLVARQRDEVRRDALTMAEFLRGLDLRIDLHEVRQDELARVAQLTARTNQFNFTGERLTEAEIGARLAHGHTCLVAGVSDRFGDYGLVGVAFLHTGADGVVVLDNMMLSCRALGRGVEHEMLAAVGTRAGSPVTIRFRETERNEPARRFLDSLGLGDGPHDPAVISAIRFDPVEPPQGARSARVTGAASGTSSHTPAAVLARIARGAVLPRESTSDVTGGSVTDIVRAAVADALDVESVPADAAFDRLNLSSFAAVEVVVALEKHFGPLPRTLLFEHRDLPSLVRHLEGEPDEVPVRYETAATADDVIAIVGVAGRYPGANDLDELWELISRQRTAISEVPAHRWNHAPLHHPAPQPGQTYSKWAALLDDVERFDSRLFGISHRDADLMDPQQRLFLEVVYEAVEDAGYTRESIGRDVGVWVGAMANNYGIISAQAALEGDSPLPFSDGYQIANRVSFFFDLAGPSIVTDTACSSSGVALHMACEALRGGTVSKAIAGGVNLILHPARHIQYAQMGLLSRDGVCRAFGAGASGFVMGEGAGAVVLKRLSDAVADGDHVHAVIRGSWVNSAGRTAGFTVPSAHAQADLVSRALANAGLGPDDIDYVEAHGPGTPLGDPVEIRALAKAFRDARRIHVGSIKPNIGHLEPASGIAGLTKVLLQLRHNAIAPSLHSAPANPYINFANTPFEVPGRALHWHAGENRPRRAGISSFGAGGVNAHVIVEEYRDTRAPTDDGPAVITLSATDEERLRAVAARLRDHVRRAAPPLRDIAHTLHVGREDLGKRISFRAEDIGDLVTKLDQVVAGRIPEHADPEPVTGRRIPLPAYPFAHTRHWLPHRPLVVERQAGAGHVLVLASDATFPSESSVDGRRLVVAIQSNAYGWMRDRLVGVRAGEPGDIRRLVEDLLPHGPVLVVDQRDGDQSATARLLSDLDVEYRTTLKEEPVPIVKETSMGSSTRHDLPGQVRRLEHEVLDITTDRELFQRTAFVRTPCGSIVVTLTTDSPKLRDWFAVNWQPAPEVTAPHAHVRVFTESPGVYGLDLPADNTRWWSESRREMTVFGTDSYSIVKVCVRGVCSVVAPDEVTFVHGCGFELVHDGTRRGVLVVGSSGAGKTTLVSGLRRRDDCEVGIVNDDWGALDLTSGTAVYTGEVCLHMKVRSVLAFRPDFFLDASSHLSEGDGPQTSPSLRVLVPPPLVYGSENLRTSTTVTDVAFVVREDPGWRPPDDIEQMITLLEAGAYSPYYQRTEHFYNGALLLLDEEERERERERYRRLFKTARVSWINNHGTPEQTVDQFLAAVGR